MHFQFEVVYLRKRLASRDQRRCIVAESRQESRCHNEGKQF